jgi:DNA-binding HxlR family transcriptional regulator
LGAVAGKWTAAVLGRLAHGPARFNALRLAVQGEAPKPPTAKVLSGELTRLTEAGIVARDEGEGRATRYALTSRGRQLVPLLDALGQWADDSCS